MNARITAVLLTLVAMVGCSQDALLDKFASKEDQAAAKQYAEYLRTGEFEKIEAVLDPKIQSPTLRQTLEQMAGLIPDDEPSSTKLVGAHTMQSPDGTTKNLTFEYGFGDKWLLLNVATHQKADQLTIVGLNVYPQARSLEEQNRFTLVGKTPVQYLVLTLAVLFALLTLYAVIVCARTNMAARKWLWILFILLGVGKVAVNWTTGEWQVTPLAVQLFSASAFAPLFGPWQLAVSFPLGAIVFLFRRNALRVEEAYE